MKALVLAAGRGTRVRPLTERMPKAMIPIINQPVMALIVDHLRRFGVSRIMVNTSYLSSAIESYFGDGQRFDVEMAYSFEGREEDGRLIDEPVGSAGAIRRIHDHSGFFDETFVVVCGDAIIDLDLGELLDFHRQKRALATIAVHQVSREEVSRYGVVIRDGDGRISEFQEKPRPEEARSCTISTGIYVFEPEVLEHIPSGVRFDIGGDLFPELARSGRLYGMQSAQPWQWLDIGQVSDLHEVTMKALRGEIRGFRIPGRELRPGVHVGINVRVNLDRCHIVPPVHIGGSAQVEDGASLVGPLAIGAGALIEAGAHLEQSVVLDYTRVRGGTSCRGKILGSQFCVDADGTILDQRHTDTAWLFADSRGDARLSEDQLGVLATIRSLAGQATA